MVTVSVERGKKDKSKGFPSLRDQLAQGGIKVYTGEQLKERLAKLEELIEKINRPLQGNTPLDKLQDLLKKIKEVDLFVHVSSMAWARAGSDAKYRRAVSGYESLVQQNIEDITIVISDLKGRDKVEQMSMALYRQLWAGTFYFQFAKFLTSVSFFDKDITPTIDNAIVVPTMQIG
ncbi:MAG: hypothetical protein HWN68_07700, partial [Desulfobacterales bacterium]|nr:hypothetical protein [Desulfobacterales bacterium]